MKLFLKTPPAIEPISLDEAKQHLRISDTTEDAYILNLIKIAREWCEVYQSRSYITQTWQLTLDAWPQERYIVLPRPPVQSVVSVKYTDKDGIEHTFSDYLVDSSYYRSRIVLKDDASWPSDALLPTPAIAIEYTAGYGNISSNIPLLARQAILLLVGHWYENREATASEANKQIEFAVTSLLNFERIWEF